LRNNSSVVFFLAFETKEAFVLDFNFDFIYTIYIPERYFLNTKKMFHTTKVVMLPTKQKTKLKQLILGSNLGNLKQCLSNEGIALSKRCKWGCIGFDSK